MNIPDGGPVSAWSEPCGTSPLASGITPGLGIKPLFTSLVGRQRWLRDAKEPVLVLPGVLSSAGALSPLSDDSAGEAQLRIVDGHTDVNCGARLLVVESKRHRTQPGVGHEEILESGGGHDREGVSSHTAPLSLSSLTLPCYIIANSAILSTKIPRASVPGGRDM